MEVVGSGPGSLTLPTGPTRPPAPLPSPSVDAGDAAPVRPSPLHLHPAWTQLALPENDSLAWRRAACRDPAATGTSEQERGGILRLLQAEDSPHQLAVPQGTRGAMNAYIHSTVELSAAVRAHLHATRDPFYARQPEINVNYGGKGASQQLWWCCDKGWKVTLPNRHLLKYLRSDGSGKLPELSNKAAKRRRLDDGTLSDEDVVLLPPVEIPARASLGDEEAEAMFAELQRKGWDVQHEHAVSSWSESRKDVDEVDSAVVLTGSDSEGGWSPDDIPDSCVDPAVVLTGSDSEGGWSPDDIPDSCKIVPAVELAEDDDDRGGLMPAINLEEVECLPPVERYPLNDLDSSNEVTTVESGATHERQVSAKKQQESLTTPTVFHNPLVYETEQGRPTSHVGSRNVAEPEPVPLQVNFAVPTGAVPGQTVKLQIGKRRFAVALPQDIREGQRLRVDTSATPPGTAELRRRLTQHYSTRLDQEWSGREMIAVTIAAAIGCIGILVSLIVLNSAGLIAVISLLASAILMMQLHRYFINRRPDQPLTMDEDILLALALILSHISVIAATMQTYETLLSSATPFVAPPGDSVGYVQGSMPLYSCQMIVHTAIGIGQAGFLTGMGARYGGGIAAETPHGGYLCWMTLTIFPFAVLIVGFVFWEAHTCEKLYVAPGDTSPSHPSVQCLDDIGFFLRCSGGFLLLLSVTAAQASNRGSLAVAILPLSAFFLLIWAADIGRGTAMGCPVGAKCSDRLTPLLILPLLAAYLSGINLFIRSKSKWTEATTTSLAFSILFCQMVAATTGGMDLNLLGAVTEDVLDQEHDTGSLSNERFSDAALPLWLTQFVFIPVVLLDRAALPILALILGSGMLGGELVIVTMPVAAGIGAIVIKLTPVPEEDLNLVLDVGLVEIASEEDNNGPDNRSRAAVCVGLTPCLAASYVTSSWGVALHRIHSNHSSIVSYHGEFAQHDDLWVLKQSAIAICAPIFLGCSHLYLHRIRPAVACCSMVGAVFLTAGVWFDNSLTWACLAICVPALLVVQAGLPDFSCRSDDKDPNVLQDEKMPATDLVHMICSLILFFCICFHRLSWQHSWACLCLLYALCWVPLSMSVSQLRRKTRPQMGTTVAISHMRLWRAGLIGPLCCTVPSIFWTVEEGQMICDTHLLRADEEQCTESCIWVLSMALPVAMVLIEWVATELSVTKCGSARWSPNSTIQRARASAIMLIAACALPYRIWLHIAQTRGIEAMITNCTDADMLASEIHADEIAEWCSFMALDVPERKIAAATFTTIIAAACTLLYILCGAMEHASVSTNRAPVPPTQSIAAALLCLACLDYYTPVLAVPLVMASSYISYASHWLSAHEGSWPTALLAAPLVWLAKSGVGILRETEKAVWGAQIFGMSPSKDLVFFIGRFNTWWTPFMGIILLTWGVGVRLYLVPKWPNDTERGEFSWEKLFYITDAMSFYAAVLMMAPLTEGWVCIIMSAAAIMWGLHVRDTTLILRLPALYLSSFLIIEAYQDVEMGTWSFGATSLACLTSAALTHFVTQPENSSVDSADRSQHYDLSGLVDITILWTFLLSWLDGPHGTTKGCLVLGLSVLSLPFLHGRGYPFLLAFTPLALSFSMFYALTNTDTGDTLYRQTISAFAGSIYGFFICLMSIVGVTPKGDVALIAVFADDNFVLVSDSDTQATWFMRKTPVTKEGYHNFLFAVGACWIYVNAVVGLYLTETSVEGCLLIAMVLGCTLIAQGTARSSANLRMAGHLQICIAVLLGAAAPGVSPACKATDANLCADAGSPLRCLNATLANHSCVWLATEMKCSATDMLACEGYFLQQRSNCLSAGKCHFDEGNHLLRSILMLIGSCWTLGWVILFWAAGCCCNCTFSHTAAEEIRPSTVMRTISTVADEYDTTGMSNSMDQQILHPALLEHETAAAPDGQSQRLQDAEAAFIEALVEEGSRDRFAASKQARTVAARMSAATRVIRKQASEVARSVIVSTERLNVRQAPSSDAAILRKLPRGTRVHVVGNHGPWLELATHEAQTAEQLVQGAGWILGRMDGASYALVE